MTKQEIYEQVVRLTAELAQTNVAELIFDAASLDNAETAQTIIDAFPAFYPDLYQEIVDFGKEFNELVGDSEEDNEERKKIFESCQHLMYSLAETKVIAQIAEAAETGDSAKVLEVIDTFKKEYRVFAENLVAFQDEYTAYRDNHKSGNEGAIFGTEADEENGVYVFDTNVIDALSFYVLTIFSNIVDVYFFCNFEDDPTSSDAFLDAIEAATNYDFAEFVATYNLLDWVGEDQKYQTVGEILVAALSNDFDDDSEETE